MVYVLSPLSKDRMPSSMAAKILDLSRIRQGKIELQQAWGKDVILIALNGWGQEEDRRERSRIRSPYA
jgi:hypothetical protein